MPEHSQSLAGKTLRWTFGEGPTAGVIYEHTFRSDGTVVWHDVSGAKKDAGEKGVAKEKPKGEKAAAPKYASFEVAPSTHLVSYLSPDSGYTLTVALNLDTQRCYGIASNEKEWYPLEGTLAPAQRDRNAA
jgi:hypothetical protein